MNSKTQDRVRRIVESGKFDPERFRRRVDFSHRFLLFIPVETQRSRRILVIGYYVFFVALAVCFVVFRGPAKYQRLLPITCYLGTALGGLTFTGPVRQFSRWQRNLRGESQDDGQPITLAWNSATRRPIPTLDRFDEHDIAVRDRAHYLAYSALRYPAMLAAMLGFIFLLDATPAQIEHLLLIASVPLAALFFSLPQAIILWTEPDLEPEPDDHDAKTAIGAAPQESRHA
jgi:hypothetical protein